MLWTDPGSGPRWFSCRIRFAHVASDSDVLLHSVSVFLVRADNHDTVLRAAPARGRREERVYPKAAGGTARTAMVAVEALDLLDGIDDGAEVACLWSEDISPNPFPMDFTFRPEASQPTSSV